MARDSEPLSMGSDEHEKLKDASRTPREVRAEDLLQGDRFVVITYHEQRYRLLLTRNGKLILQK